MRSEFNLRFPFKSKNKLALTLLCASLIGFSGFAGASAFTFSAYQVPTQSSASQSWISSSSSQAVGCVEPLPNPRLGAYYSSSYCYGHDEAILGFISNESGSGTNAALNVTLPQLVSGRPQGDLYISFWFGGIVYDPKSVDSQAFMELQFYPAAPQFEGPGSGPKDCSAQGFYFNNSTGLDSNDWFACLFVFALNTTSDSEYVPYASTMTVLGSANSTMLMNGNDLISIKLNGTAQSSTLPWEVSLTDYSTSQSGLLYLKNGTSVFPPYYDVSQHDSGLGWGAAETPAIDFAFELGHTVGGDCSGVSFSNGGSGGVPGDLRCYSYWPDQWELAGLVHIYPPLLGSIPKPSSQISFSSAEGGVSEIYNSSQSLSKCTGPSFSTTLNCIYPFYVYEINSGYFAFTSSITPGTIDYGNTFEFPGTTNQTTGQYLENVQQSPSYSVVTATQTQTLNVVSLGTVTSTKTTVSTTTQTVSLPVQPLTLTVEVRSSGGSPISGQIVRVSNYTGFTTQGITDASGVLLITGLSRGSDYNISSTFAGQNTTTPVSFTGDTLVILQPPPQGIPFYFLFVASALIVIGLATFIAVIMRKRVR
jgi:hypothetical protein